jgi:hypothetical protein
MVTNPLMIMRMIMQMTMSVKEVQMNKANLDNNYDNYDNSNDYPDNYDNYDNAEQEPAYEEVSDFE